MNASHFLSTIRKYLQPGYERRRMLMTVIGVCVTGMSVGLFKVAAFGVDPYQCLCNGLNNVIPISFGTLYMLINLLTLIVVLIVDRQYIGLGTFINLFLLGYIIDGSETVLTALLGTPSMAVRIACICIGMIILCFAASLYMTANMGVSTYDFIAMHLAAKKVGPFRFLRIGTDVLCVVIGTVCGCMPGVGTILTAFGTGPLISFFSDIFSKPLLNGTLGSKAKAA